MLKTVLLVLAGLGAGLAVSFLLKPGASGFDSAGEGAESSIPTATRNTDSSTVARLAELESALAAEATQRTALEARVLELAGELDDLRAARVDAPGDAAVADNSSTGDAVRFRPREFTGTGADTERRQIERLIAAGFAPDRAEWISRRTSELRMEQLQAQYNATREGRPFDPTAVLASERTLRSELGEADYERYLTAFNRPTSVAVRDVLASSPAERSGLKAGDEVVSYGGTRVFDMRELNALTLEGNAGESVVVDVRRDGQTIQLVMPRGPIGIFSGGFRGR